MSDIRFKSEMEADATAREDAKFTCACGADYAEEVKALGYPKWHAPDGHTIRFMDECATLECAKKICHACAATCKICGCRYCPEHTTYNLATSMGLCVDCEEDYVDIPSGSERDRLIEIRGRLQNGNSYYKAYGYVNDLACCLKIAQDNTRNYGLTQRNALPKYLGSISTEPLAQFFAFLKHELDARGWEKEETNEERDRWRDMCELRHIGETLQPEQLKRVLTLLRRRETASIDPPKMREDVRLELQGALDNCDGSEINPSNYSHDDACHLNDTFVELFRVVERALGDK